MTTSLYGIRQQLEDRLDQLRRRTGAVERDLRRLQHPDSEERATEAENDQVLEHLGDGGREEITRIEAAIARMEAGSYGTCDLCGEPIPDARLQALPFASTCVDCAETAG